MTIYVKESIYVCTYNAIQALIAQMMAGTKVLKPAIQRPLDTLVFSASSVPCSHEL